MMSRASHSRNAGRLLVVGPGPDGRGGIAAVIQMHQKSALWARRHARLLATYDDRSRWNKVRAALRAYVLAPLYLRSADIVHIHLAAQVSLFRKLPIVALARLFRKPIVVHLHAATEDSLFAHTPRWAVRFTFLSAARIIALSESWAALIHRHIPEATVTVIPNPVLSHEPIKPPPTAIPVILFIGKLDARKGYRDLLAAAALVLHDFPAAEFRFAGHGEVEQARLQARRLGIERSIRLLGWVDRPQLEAIYRQTTILALPSYGEGVPMSVLEAMSHAIPVVCTPVGGIPEWIEDKANGLLVAPGDIPALAENILHLLHNPQCAQTIGQAGRQTVESRCTLETVATALDNLYNEVLHTRSSS